MEYVKYCDIEPYEGQHLMQCGRMAGVRVGILGAWTPKLDHEDPW